MFTDKSIRVPHGSTVTVHTPYQPGWLWPGAALIVVVLVTLGAIRGEAGEERSPTPRIVPIAQEGGSALLAEPAQGAAKLADLPNGTKVEVKCHTRGPETSGWGGTSKVWDKVAVGGVTGYVPDVAVNTVVRVGEIAPRC